MTVWSIMVLPSASVEIYSGVAAMTLVVMSAVVSEGDRSAIRIWPTTACEQVRITGIAAISRSEIICQVHRLWRVF